MTNKYFAGILLGVACCLIEIKSHAKMDVQVVTSNDSEAIQDGRAEVIVSGAVGVVTYHWSRQDVATDANTVGGLDEGVTYTVDVADASSTTSIDVLVPASSFPEKMNAVFVPVVNALATVMYWDPLAALGIRDGILRNGEGKVMCHPNGDPVVKPVRFIVLWLILGALFFTVYMRFVNFRGFRHAIHLMQGKYDREEDEGEVSHFQALSAALSGTLGLGNIAGVALAIAIGGAGATFWMIVAGLIGMSSKFVECTLGVKYRVIDGRGEVSGGPMYYLSRGLALRNMKGLGKVLAVTFAILCVFGSIGGGNMFQSNQVMAQVVSTIPSLSEYALAVGVVIAILAGLVMVGGIKSIAGVTEKLVPFMVVVYMLFALIIIGVNIQHIGDAFASIFHGAFGGDALRGGFVGVMMIGFQRAAFSNDAGDGSASIAHSASKTKYPVSEGIIALMEPFIDTVVVCTITALVLIFTGYAADPQGMSGSALTNAAFTSHFPWFKWVLLISIFCFAYATIISWGYYGLKSWTYLFGNSALSANVFKVIYLAGTALGAMVGLGAVMDFSDMMILGMAFPNIIGLLIMAPEVKRDMQAYFSDLKSGKIIKYR
ncbi:MAG: alanine:cation symporter family protein [Flavobacteriales bacterium]|nr:alanine:cation symporter family protein [Flavobacteriales bacterium]